MQKSGNVKFSWCFSQGLPGLPGEAGPTGFDGQQVGIAKQENKMIQKPCSRWKIQSNPSRKLLNLKCRLMFLVFESPGTSRTNRNWRPTWAERRSGQWFQLHRYSWSVYTGGIRNASCSNPESKFAHISPWAHVHNAPMLFFLFVCFFHQQCSLDLNLFIFKDLFHRNSIL